MLTPWISTHRMTMIMTKALFALTWTNRSPIIVGLTHSLSEWVTRSPIELSWTAKNPAEHQQSPNQKSYKNWLLMNQEICARRGGRRAGRSFHILFGRLLNFRIDTKHHFQIWQSLRSSQLKRTDDQALSTSMWSSGAPRRTGFQRLSLHYQVSLSSHDYDH